MLWTHREPTRPRGRQRRLAVLTVGTMALGLAGPAVLAGEGGDDSGAATTVADALVDRARDIAGAAGVDADDVLGQVVTVAVPDGAGGVQDLTAPIGEVLGLLGGGLTLDEGDGGDTDEGDAGGDDPAAPGLPHLTAGGAFHIAANLSIETFSLVPEADLPPAPDVSPYDVVESGYLPSTPLVPGVNPVFLAAQLAGVELPPELLEVAPGVDDPILLLHPGGRLTSVQGGDWSLMGAHGAGSYELGHNVDTGPREDAEDPWPVWAPFVTGTLAHPDTEVDFVGFGIIVNTSDCTLVRASSNPASPLYPRIVARACVGVGAIIGDGLAAFDGTGPIDFRQDLMPLWEPAPEELAPVLDAVDELVAQVDEVTGGLLDALDLDPMELLDPDSGDEPAAPAPAPSGSGDPEDGGEGGDVGEEEPAPSGGLLGLVGDLLP